MTRRAVFLDRDGTLNVDKGYVYRWEDWEWIPGAVEAIRGFNKAGFLAVVISNQAGVARGLYKAEDVLALHERVNRELAAQGARVEAFYFCPHHPLHGTVRDCPCRKPKPGLILQAGKELDVDLVRSYLIGDKAIDVLAAQAAGVTPVLVRGYGSEQETQIPADVPVVENIFEAQKFIQKIRAF